MGLKSPEIPAKLTISASVIVRPRDWMASPSVNSSKYRPRRAALAASFDMGKLLHCWQKNQVDIQRLIGCIHLILTRRVRLSSVSGRLLASQPAADLPRDERPACVAPRVLHRGFLTDADLVRRAVALVDVV